jgi:hypothetical protein
MFIVIYTGIWLAVTLFTGGFGFLLGKLPIVDTSHVPWVMHRSYVPAELPKEPEFAGRWPGTPGAPDWNRDQAA